MEQKTPGQVLSDTVNEILNAIIADTLKLRNKGVELGIAVSEDDLSEIATKFATELINRGTVNANVKEGESYTIQPGVYQGGTVAGVGGGGSYLLQEKTVTPTKAQQIVTSDDGYYGLSEVVMLPIPSIYQDVSATTATADNVLSNKVFIAANGATVAGTMPNNGSQNKVIDVLVDASATIPAGYTSGATITIADSLLERLREI